jgi:phosphate transport system protein
MLTESWQYPCKLFAMNERTAARHSYREALGRVAHDVLAMGVLVEEAVLRAIDSLRDRNVQAALEVTAGDAAIDLAQTRIEDLAIALVATEQPVATDLRRLVTGLKIVTQLERMGDHAAHVAKAAVDLAAEDRLDLPPQIHEMGLRGHAMLQAALSALVDNDAGRTKALADMDRQVDLLYDRAVDELTGRMRRSPALVDPSLRLILVCRDLERLADHATNIGEWIVYGETAQHVELNP